MSKDSRAGQVDTVVVGEIGQPTGRSGGLRERPPSAGMLLAVGGVVGLAWSTGLRGFMAEVAGAGSRVDWVGTFGWILLPGVVTGVLLGWAEFLRQTGGRRGWRWLALSPLVLGAVTLHRPWDLPLLLTEDPLGGGRSRWLCTGWQPATPCRDADGCGDAWCVACSP